MSTERICVLALLALACAKQPSSGDEYSEDDVDWPDPELCEVRQIRSDGELAGPGDLVAVCDAEGTRPIAFSRPSPVTCTTGYVECECDLETCQSALGPGARCIEGGDGCECVVPCVRDGDCADDEACVCRSGVVTTNGVIPVTTLSASVAMCGPADCRIDADCGPGATCSISASLCPYAPHLFCKLGDSSCIDDEDCPQGEGCYPTGEAWTCVDAGCGP